MELLGQQVGTASTFLRLLNCTPKGLGPFIFATEKGSYCSPFLLTLAFLIPVKPYICEVYFAFSWLEPSKQKLHGQTWVRRCHSKLLQWYRETKMQPDLQCVEAKGRGLFNAGWACGGDLKNIRWEEGPGMCPGQSIIPEFAHFFL